MARPIEFNPNRGDFTAHTDLLRKRIETAQAELEQAKPEAKATWQAELDRLNAELGELGAQPEHIDIAA